MQGKNQVNPSTLADDITSHELRNALCGIFGLVDLLESSGLNPVQQSLVAALKRSSRQMNWLMDAFVPRGDNIQFHSSARRVAANGIDLLEQLIQCHLVAAQDNSIRLLLVVDSGMPEDWRVDRYLLWLVLDNLLGNAIKYGGPGEVVLEARRQKATDSAVSGLEIRVRDSGPGIDRPAQERIFEPGVRLTDDAMNNDGEGLGLYVCKCIVSELQGTIRYHSGDSRGSRFTVRLPDTLANTSTDSVEAPPRLLRSLVCVLCLPGNLCDSLTAIIQRLGVSRIVSPETGGMEAAEGNCVIEITCQELERSGARQQTELLLTHVSRCPGDGLPVRARHLAEPFLESTVAPVLMELAFACRLSGAARGS